MIKLKIKAIAILLGVLFSCTKNNSVTTVDPLTQFSKTIELKEPKIIISDLLDPTGIIILDSLIMVSEPNNDPMVSLYCLSGKFITSFLRKGRGPGETSNLLDISPYTDSIIQISVDPESVFLYNKNDLLSGNLLPYNEYNLPKGNYAFSTIMKYSDNEFLYVGKNSNKRDECDNRFCIYHADSDAIDFFGEYPVEDVSITKFPTEDYSKLNAYQGKPLLKPDHSKSVIIYYYAVGFDIIDLETLKVDKNIFYQYPQVETAYIPELKANAIKRNMNAFRGFLDAWCSDNHIYFLYSAKTFSAPDYSIGQYILKYNWDGDPICLYQLDKEISCFALDKDETYIYAGLSEETEARILRYNLK